MRAAVVAAGIEQRFGRRDRSQSFRRGCRRAGAGGVRRRADDQKIIEHNRGPRVGAPFFRQAALALRIVRQRNIDVSSRDEPQNLAGSGDDNADLYARLGFEQGQKM